MSLIPPPVRSALVAIRQTLYSLGIKEPWKYTGSWTNPDHLHYLPTGRDYRKVSPGSALVKAITPHDPPKLVYDIKYHVRDFRRNNIVKQRTVDASPFDFNKMFASAPVKPGDIKHVPMPPTMPTRGY